MAFIGTSSALGGLIDPGTEVEQLASGFGFAEGPVWDPDKGILHFSDIPGDVRYSWSPTEGVRETRRPSNKCNGMVFDLSRNLLVCEHSSSSLVRETRSGNREVLATHFEGKELNSPNDIVVRSDGMMYFSDPSFGRGPVYGVDRPLEQGFQAVYRLPPSSEAGSEPTLVVGREDFEQPNGLCFSPDERLLYINDSSRALIRVYDVDPEGDLSNGRLFFDGIGDGVVADGLVDGMKVDERGDVWVTGPGGVWIISAEGEHLGVISVPENVGNIAWGGESWSTLYMPSSTSLYRIETKVASAPLPYH